MHIFRTKKEISQFIDNQRIRPVQIGFVPTMGALHQGHIELVKKSRNNQDLTICSIFVNPKQFNNQEDYENYPITEKSDVEILENMGCDAVFIPHRTEIYPSPDTESTTIQLGFLDTVGEGLYRPGHFSGVATVVIKLFNIIRPDRVYFGQKDLQQVAVIRQLINDLSYSIDLILVPTVRENDGLAFSSRNVRIPIENRKSAVLFYQSLIHAKNQFLSGTPIPVIRDHIKNSFSDHSECILEYIEFVDPLNFRPITTLKINSVVGICIAGYIRNIRLIDNLLINT